MPEESLNDLLPTTPDLRAERLTELKRLFPDLFTNEGRLDPDELKRLVAPNEVHETERYEFKWYGKAASKREAFTPTTATLVYDPARSVNPDQANGNMIIEGENLETLKLLLSAYREQVKVIYIDPPYNTGKDFIYKDNYAKDRKSYWEETESTSDGIKLDSNPDTSGRYHSDWLSMMHSRLLVARSLLRPSGVIFVSIDDNEVQNLRRIMDEVFGEENFVANIVWQKAYTSNQTARFISNTHDHILLYSRSADHFEIGKFPRSEEQKAKFKNPSNDPRGPWKAENLSAGKYYAAGQFPITGPAGTVFHPPPGRYWRCNEAQYNAWLADDRITFGQGDDGRPMLKKFLSELEDGLTANTWWEHEEFGSNKEASIELKEIFGGEAWFDTPKPVKLLKKILELVDDKEALVFDFFGGSGTTAQAVLEQNKADGGTRHFILSQIQESTLADSDAYRDGFKKISDITIERAKRVIARMLRESEELLPNNAQSQYANGLSFKVYKLTKSNFPRCEYAPDPKVSEAENVEALKHYIDEKETAFLLPLAAEAEQAVFDEVLLKCGFQLHYTRSLREDFAENTVFEVTDGKRSSLVCLAWNEAIKDSTLKQLRALDEAGDKPFFICLERSLNTTAKWNLNHLLGKRLTAF